jgi:hypothetical protein
MTPQEQKAKLKQIMSDLANARNFVLDEIRGSSAITDATGSESLSLYNTANLPLYLNSQVSTPGMLPDPESFKILGIRFSLNSSNGKPIVFRDYMDIISHATYKLSIAQIPQLEGVLWSHVPSNIVVLGGGATEVVYGVGLCSYVNLSGRPIWIKKGFNYTMDVNITKAQRQASPNDYATLYGTLYLTCQLMGIKGKAISAS